MPTASRDDVLRELEARQDEALIELDALDQKIVRVLREWGADFCPSEPVITSPPPFLVPVQVS